VVLKQPFIIRKFWETLSIMWLLLNFSEIVLAIFVKSNILKFLYEIHMSQVFQVSVGDVIIVHELRTPNEGKNQRYLKNWADVADKIYFGRT
jgi:hypothetical protein